MPVTLSFKYMVYFYRLDRSFHDNTNVNYNINIICFIVTFENVNIFYPCLIHKY